MTMRRLKKKQKEAVLAWIAEGLETGEINERAAKFKPPFDVSRAQVDYFRSTRDADLKAIQAAGEFEALTQGYALKENRVKALQVLASLMYRDITGGFLWLDQIKALGSGEHMETFEYEEFNASEIQQLRGVFDDIAKEMGHRKIVATVDDGLTDDQRLARLTAIFDAARARRDRQADGETANID